MSYSIIYPQPMNSNAGQSNHRQSCAWARLDFNERRQRLENLHLHLNAPEPAIVCRLCAYALRTAGDRVARHLWEKHQVPAAARYGLTAFIKTLCLPDANKLDCRPDGSAPHPYLISQTGAVCKHCGYRSTSLDLVTRHLAKEHGRKRSARNWLRDDVRDNVQLQSWTQNGVRGYWIVSQAMVGTSSPTSALSPQTTPRRRARVDHLHNTEIRRLADSRSYDTTSVGAIDDDNPVLTSNWIRRTGWTRTYKDARRHLLVRLTDSPDTRGGPLYLGKYNGQLELSISAESERRLLEVGQALDRLFDRCEDTARHTDVSIRQWLRSQHRKVPYKAPFELPGRDSTRKKYRLLWKRFTYFIFRLYLLDPVIRKSLLSITLAPSQTRAIERVWKDAYWKDLHCPIQCYAQLEQLQPGQEEEKKEQGVEEESKLEDDIDSDCSSEEDANSDTASDLNSPEVVHPPAEEQESREGVAIEDPLADLLGQQGVFFATEEYRDGLSSSTLLVYFSGILGFSHDGLTFARPGNYTSNLSGLIYSIRLLILESTLPRYSHTYAGWVARPHYGQLRRLNDVRRRFMCLGSQAPMDEFFSLRSYGRAFSRSDGPSFRVRWSDDGQTIYWDNHILEMKQFRQLGHHVLEAASTSCKRLMYGWQVDVPLDRIRDEMSNTTNGYSFIEEPANNLSAAYLDLSRRACLDGVDGLMTGDCWDLNAVARYLESHETMLQQLMLLMYLLGGQAPRTTELFSIEYCNGPSTSRGVYVYAGRIIYITRHHKARQSTNKEFHVVRYLPRAAGLLLYKYLVYIRPLAAMLRRVCFGDSESFLDSGLLYPTTRASGKSWTSNTLSKSLQKYSKDIFDCAIGAQIYRQLSIAITEKHVKQISRPFNRFDDKAADADIDIVFAWQSGHRPIQRGTTYGLDGAFPDTLQPALLRVYEWASREWHHFLGLEAEAVPVLSSNESVATRPQPNQRSTLPVQQKCSYGSLKRAPSPLRDSSVSTEPAVKRTRRTWPWANSIDEYRGVQQEMIPESLRAGDIPLCSSTPRPGVWPGKVPLFVYPVKESLQRARERHQILAKIQDREAEIKPFAESRWLRFCGYTEKFRRWRECGCPLCFLNGCPNYEHDLLGCEKSAAAGRARATLQWLENLDIPRRIEPGLGLCSLCQGTDHPCREICLGCEVDSAAATGNPEYERLLREKLTLGPTRDGYCENKAPVRAAIAALCTYDNGFFGSLLAARLQEEEKIDLTSEAQVRSWFEYRLKFDCSWIPRILLVFEMLVNGLKARTSIQAVQHASAIGRDTEQSEGSDDDYSISDSSEDKRKLSARSGDGKRSASWKDYHEGVIRDLEDSLQWWQKRCGFCAGKGRRGGNIEHQLQSCPSGGQKQRQIRLGEAIYEEGLKSQVGCELCGLPANFCNRESGEDGQKRLMRQDGCRYGTTVYDTVIGIFQSGNPTLPIRLLIEMEEEGDEEYSRTDDETVVLWLMKGIEIHGVKYAEIILTFLDWSKYIRKRLDDEEY